MIQSSMRERDTGVYVVAAVFIMLFGKQQYQLM